MSTFVPADVQIDALNKSRGKRGFAYLMEMGLGKTATDLLDTEWWVDNEDVTRLVVVCPNSFKKGWVEEIKKWGFDMDPYVFNSGDTWNNSQFLKKKYNCLPVLIVNYEAVRSESTREYILKFLAGRKGKVTFDESIQLKTHDSAQTKACIDLAKHFWVKRLLSGKWIVTGNHDTWAQMRAIGQLDGYNYFAFRNRYCEMGGFKGKAITGSRNTEELAERYDPYVYKAFKADHLPIAKAYSKREYKLHPIVQKHYDSMLNEFMTWLSEDKAVTVEVAITKYAKLAQIQAGFIIDEQGGVNWLVEDKHNTRLQSLIEFVETEMVSKLLIPYHHKAVFALLNRTFKHLNPAFIMGGMTPDDIESQKAKFNTDNSCRVAFLQIKASKYGHTLLGGPEPENRCSSMAFFENTYSLDDRSQVEDRNHRRGQIEDSCSYTDFVGTDIDDRMIDALVRRENMFRAFMSLIGR